MQSPGPPPPPPPAGPHSRFQPGQPLYAGGGGGGPPPLHPPPPAGGLAPPSVGYVAPSPTGIAPPSSAGGMRPYSAASRPYSTGPPQAHPGPPGPPGPGGPGGHPPIPMSPVYPAAPAQARYRPGKRIIVCCDGTWLDSDMGLKHNNTAMPSNVTRISRAIKAQSADGVAQVVYYHAGVGTAGGPVSRATGGATAKGLSQDIRDVYAFIALNYSQGDEVYLVGFSRGAFTARSVGGLMCVAGLLTKTGIDDLAVVFQDVENRNDEDYESPFPNVPFPNKPSAGNPGYAAELEKRGLSRINIPIKAIAVWETVGSLGIPRVPWLEAVGLQQRSVKEYAFYDTSLSDLIENAFQALALDEQRASFEPTLWERPKNKTNRTNLRQVWFPGVHSNIGGGYPDTDTANITLAWMIAQLEHMLDFNQEYLREQYLAAQSYYDQSNQEARPWSFGEIYRSLQGLYSVGGRAVRTPGNYTRMDPTTGRRTARSKLRDTNEYIHPSARARVGLAGPGVEDRGVYEPPALLKNYKLRLTGAQPGGAEPIAVWESHAKSRAKGGEAGGGSKRVLAESPLFETEMRLLRGSPWVEGYLFGGGGGDAPGKRPSRHNQGQSNGGPGGGPPPPGGGGYGGPGPGGPGGGPSGGVFPGPPGQGGHFMSGAGGGGGGGGGGGRRNRDERREERRQERRRSGRDNGGRRHEMDAESP